MFFSSYLLTPPDCFCLGSVSPLLHSVFIFRSLTHFLHLIEVQWELPGRIQPSVSLSASSTLSAVWTTVACVWHRTHSSATSSMGWDPPSLLGDRRWRRHPWVREDIYVLIFATILQSFFPYEPQEPISRSSTVSSLSFFCVNEDD